MLEKKVNNWLENILGKNFSIEKERHGDQSDVFRIKTSKKEYFLKVASNLKRECENLAWLEDRMLVPKVIGFSKIDNNDVLLSSALKGENLAVLCKKWSAEEIIEKLAEVLVDFHRTDIKNCPFRCSGENKVLIHGDACLPNFIFYNNNFSGYIDLGDVRIGDVEIDLAAAVWSLQYNLGSGYGLKFLRKYGINGANEELVSRLIKKYEAMQKRWGL